MNEVTVIKRIVDIEQVFLQQGYIEPPFTDGNSWLECDLLLSQELEYDGKVHKKSFYHVYADGYEDCWEIDQMNTMIQQYLSETFPNVQSYDWEWITEPVSDDKTSVLGIKVITSILTPSPIKSDA